MKLVAVVKPVTAPEDAARALAQAAGLALAWVLAQGNDVVAIPGTTTRKHLEENLRAASITLGTDELARIDAVAPKGAAAGERYPAQAMAAVHR